MKRAVIYLRVSTEKQVQTWTNEDGLSLSAQEDICRAHAHQLDAEVVEVYKEKGVSGRKRDRRVELARLLEDIQTTKPVDFVIVYKLDRLARNTVDDVQLAEEIEAAGARLVSVMEQFDNASPQGWLMHRMFAMFAEYEVKNSGQRVAVGMQRKAELGGTPGVPPIGYMNERDFRSGGRGVAKVVIDPERAPLIRLAFELYASGDWSILQLVRELDERGLRSKPRQRTAVPRALQKGEIQRLLRNRYYLGLVVYKGEVYKGEHEALIDQQTFDRVQELLSSRNQSGSRYRIHNHYLKGMLFCARCGTRFYEMNVRNSQGNIYPYFACRGRSTDRTCSMRYLPAELIEERVERLYDQTLMSQAEIAEVRRVLHEEIHRIDEENRTVVRAQEDRLKRLTEEERQNAAAYRADALSLEALKEERERIDKERADARRVIDRASIRYTDLTDVIEQALDLAENWTQAYRQAPPRVRRLLNQAFFERIEVEEHEVTPVLTFAYQRLRETAGLTAQLEAEGRRRARYERAGARTEAERAGQGPFQAPDALNPRHLHVRGSDKKHLVRPLGLEPRTCGLRVRCSAN